MFLSFLFCKLLPILAFTSFMSKIVHVSPIDHFWSPEDINILSFFLFLGMVFFLRDSFKVDVIYFGIQQSS